jgi:hypothetical protein
VKNEEGPGKGYQAEPNDDAEIQESSVNAVKQIQHSIHSTFPYFFVPYFFVLLS